MPDYTGGYSGAVNQLSEMQSRGVMDAVRLQAIAQAQRQMQARQALGGVLGQVFGGGMPPQVPPPPGTVAGGPMPPGVGVSSQPSAPPMPIAGALPPPPTMQAGAGAPGAPPMAASGGAAAPMASPPIPPFRPLPSAPPPGAGAAGAPGAQGGAIPPPPTADAPAAPVVNEPRPINLQALVDGFKKAGIPQDRWMDMLTEFEPVMNSQNRQELLFLQANNSALKAANDVYLKTLNLGLRSREVDVKEDAEARRGRQGDRNLDIKAQKEARLREAAAKGAGGAANLKTTELIYPKGADGRPDETQAPIGVRGITKSGRIVTLDAEGKAVTAGELAGGTAKEAKDTKASGAQNVRTGIVRAGVTNSLNRLDEIERVHPKGTTSLLFGKSADGVASGAGHAALRGMQSRDQQDIDAKWASFIDEAIPVFTGGLRGSDAFRRFLIEQAPQPNAKPEVIKEKMRLFRENIQGTSKAFFGKFASDPAMWPPGVTKEQVEAAKGGEAPAAGGPKKIAGDADYAALPSGAEFIAPDGTKRRKP